MEKCLQVLKTVGDFEDKRCSKLSGSPLSSICSDKHGMPLMMNGRTCWALIGNQLALQIGILHGQDFNPMWCTRARTHSLGAEHALLLHVAQFSECTAAPAAAWMFIPVF